MGKEEIELEIREEEKAISLDAPLQQVGTLGVPISDNNRIPSFSRLDEDGSGGIELAEFKILFSENTPIDKIKKAFDKLDKDKNGQLDRKEYMKVKAVSYAQHLLLPQNSRIAHEYSCTPPPIFMITITFFELSIFAYHYFKLRNEEGRNIHKYGPAFVKSRIIFNPNLRYEVWRYLTYMFVHTGYMHLVNNVIMQVFLGFLLELVHKWWRLLIIYLSGVLFGSLFTYLFHPTFYLAGASGGVYALIFAHMSTVILNWPEMQMPWVRVVLFTAYISFDVGVAVYFNYIVEQDTRVGYAAHIGGGIAGFLTGIIVLKNLEPKKWETIVWWISVGVLTILTLFTISWNIFA